MQTIAQLKAALAECERSLLERRWTYKIEVERGRMPRKLARSRYEALKGATQAIRRVLYCAEVSEEIFANETDE